MRSTRIVLLGLMGALGVVLIWPMPVAQAQGQEYNVLDYGASNDRVTPTKAEINRLSDDVPEAPATLVFPGGTYFVCDILRYHANQTWKFLDHATIKLGDGCVSRLIDTSLGMTLVGILQPAARGQSNITFLHLAIDGNKRNNPTTNSGDGLELMDVSDLLVSSPRIETVPCDALGLAISSSRGIQVSGVLTSKVISVGNGRGFSVQGVKNVQFQNCLAYRNAQDGFYLNNTTAKPSPA
jgi:hypothetical protein